MATTTTIDPVCGMTVDPPTARRTSEYAGTTHYFCAPACKKAFDADPTRYLSGAGRPAAAGGGCACCATGRPS